MSPDTVPPIRLWKQIGNDYYQYWHSGSDWFVEKTDWTEPVCFTSERDMIVYFEDLKSDLLLRLFGWRDRV